MVVKDLQYWTLVTAASGSVQRIIVFFWREDQDLPDWRDSVVDKNYNEVVQDEDNWFDGNG